MLRLSCFGKTVHLDLYFFLYLSGVEGEERQGYQDGFTTWGSTTSGPQRSEGYSFKKTDFFYTVHDETVHQITSTSIHEVDIHEPNTASTFVFLKVKV